jgi:hypothetical protein
MDDSAETTRLEAEIQAAATEAAARPAEEPAFGQGHAAPGQGLTRTRKLMIAGAAVIVVAAAAVIAVVATSGGTQKAANQSAAAGGHPTAAPAAPATHHPVPATGAQLAAVAKKATAGELFAAPSKSDWFYLDDLQTYSKSGTTPPDSKQVTKTWQQIGTTRNASVAAGGKLSYGGGGGSGTTLAGWPGTSTSIYTYLAQLPATQKALRKVILVNNKSVPHSQGGKVTGAFNAIQSLLADYAVPPRLQAQFYGVLVSLPGVQYETSAVDSAGRTGVGLYLVEYGWLKQEIIINSQTYAYLGNMGTAVRKHTSYATGAKVVFRKGESFGGTAQLAAGIVKRAGQVPG